MIKINNKIYVGNNITITNGKVIIDGVNQNIDDKIINIQVDSNLESLEFDCAESCIINGNVTSLQSTNGNVTVTNDILGNVSTVNGNVKANSIKGSVKTVNGNIKNI